MKKKLPELYKNSDFTHINNNKRVFYSNIDKDNNVTDNLKVDLDNEYILNTPVMIETRDGTKISCKIVSKIGDHILTSNNKIIKLDDIKFIKGIFN